MQRLCDVTISGCITVPRVEGQYSVPEATSGMRHRYSSIAHSIQLVQPAWLKAGGHQQQITCSCDLVTHGHIEANPASCLVGVCTLQPAHPCLQSHTLLCCHLPSDQPRTHALDRPHHARHLCCCTTNAALASISDVSIIIQTSFCKSLSPAGLLRFCLCPGFQLFLDIVAVRRPACITDKASFQGTGPRQSMHESHHYHS